MCRIRAVRTPYVRSAERPRRVRAWNPISGFLQIVDRNVQLIRNVRVIWRVSIKNVATCVRVVVVRTRNVMLSIIVQFVPAFLVSLAILSAAVYTLQVSLKFFYRLQYQCYNCYKRLRMFRGG